MKAKNFDELYKEILEVKKDLEEFSNKLNSQNILKNNNVAEDILNLSEKCDAVILKYEYLLNKSKQE